MDKQAPPLVFMTGQISQQGDNYTEKLAITWSQPAKWNIGGSGAAGQPSNLIG